MDQFCLQQGNHDRFFTEYSGYVLKWHKQHHIMSLEKPLRPGPARMQKMKYTDKLKKKKKSRRKNTCIYVGIGQRTVSANLTQGVRENKHKISGQLNGSFQSHNLLFHCFVLLFFLLMESPSFLIIFFFFYLFFLFVVNFVIH